MKYILLLIAGSAALIAAPRAVSKPEWEAIQAEFQRHNYTASPVEGGWRARGHAQDFSMFFDGQGFEVTPPHGSWKWGLRLTAYGYEGQLRSVSKSTPAADGKKFSYLWDSNLREWWITGDTVEHGYTLNSRPGKGSGLRFHLEIRGRLKAQVAVDGRSVAFAEREGLSAVLNYNGLKVVDATGREIEARFFRESAGLRLDIDDANAQYPITVDPIIQTAHILGPVIASGFGDSIAADGDFVVVGAPFESFGGLFQPGAVYIYYRTSPTSWVQAARIQASNPDPGDYFGHTVAISGTTVVVGAWGEDSSSPSFPNLDPNHDAGAAYVFQLTSPPCTPGPACIPSAWPEQAFLKARTPRPDTHFSKVAISADTIAVGSPELEIAGWPGAGMITVFTRSGTTWTWQTELASPQPLLNANFGTSLAIDGNTLVAGTSRDYLIFPTRAYVFTRTAGTWNPVGTTLAASNQELGDLFGFSVAINGDTVIVGAPGEWGNGTSPSDNSVPNAGAAYVFTRSPGGTVWTQQSYLKAPNPAGTPSEQFGYSVSLNGDLAMIGAPTASGYGRAYVFTRSGTAWTQQGAVQGSMLNGDKFGQSTAASAGTVAAGARGESSGTGAAWLYSFTTSPPPPTTVKIRFNTSPPGGTISTAGTGCDPGTRTIGVTPLDLNMEPGSVCLSSIVTPPAGLRFTHWEDSSTNASRSFAVPSCVSPMPCASDPTIAAATLTASFGANVTVLVSPAGAGAVIWPPGKSCVGSCNAGLLDAVPAPRFTATSTSGFTFQGWFGDCTGTNPCIPPMTGDKTIIANFNPPTTILTVALGPKTPPESTVRVWPLVFLNNGPGPVTGVQITSFSLSVRGISCSPVITGALGPVGDIPALSTLTRNVTINFTGCNRLNLYNLTMTYTANGGTINQRFTANNQPQ